MRSVCVASELLGVGSGTCARSFRASKSSLSLFGLAVPRMSWASVSKLRHGAGSGVWGSGEGWELSWVGGVVFFWISYWSWGCWLCCLCLAGLVAWYALLVCKRG